MNQYQKYNQNYINGTWVDGKENKTVKMQNPYNNEVLAQVSIASLDQINAAFDGAKNAQTNWGKDAALHQEVMENAVEYFKENKDDILEVLTLESGSTAVKANLEFDLTIGLMEEASTMVNKIGKFEEKSSIIPGKMNENYRLPKGVISSIAPFNFPVYLSMRTIAPALALGNAVVHKADIQCNLSRFKPDLSRFKRILSQFDCTPSRFNDILPRFNRTLSRFRRCRDSYITFTVNFPYTI